MRVDGEACARSTAFVKAQIGKPWRAGAAGPDAYDCWGLARAFQRDVMGRELPLVMADPLDLRAVIEEIAHSTLRTSWRETGLPTHGDLVTLAHHQFPAHIGVVLPINRGGVLHCARPIGVVYEGFAALKASGWGRLRFHHFTGVA